MENDRSKEQTRGLSFQACKDVHNFYHDGGNGVNAYGGSNHVHGDFISRVRDDYENFTARRHVEVANFSSYAKSFKPTSYDDYRGYERVNARYDYYEHIPYDSSYISHVSITGDTCSISFGGGLFLVIPYVSKCLSYHASLEAPLLNSGSILDPSCHDYRLMTNASIDSIVVGLRLEWKLMVDVDQAPASLYQIHKLLCPSRVSSQSHKNLGTKVYLLDNLDRNNIFVVNDSSHDDLHIVSDAIEPREIDHFIQCANHHTIGFLENNCYGFDDSLISLLGDPYVNFQGELVEDFEYLLPSRDTYVKSFVDHTLVDKRLLLVNGLFEISSC
ncbi:hypothetical protein M9H77_23384 [Catharanthus roseus]|uniref:Uncharacterized protein n=1 Tax=Catharanthus roseus TaxID=4058 RepID=A0ACC0ATJ7_CATRO|nr:hypothetical protein M9H77_23384 [Catharanthus roseus]